MSIYRVNDVVYHYEEGKGVVEGIELNGNVTVLFDRGERCECKPDGVLGRFDKVPTLSFTPYDLIKGGFSQERPKQEIEKGSLIWVKDKHSVVWSYGKFTGFDEDKVWVEAINRMGSIIPYDEYSLQNPLT